MSAAMAMRVRALEERLAALEAKMEELQKQRKAVTRRPGAANKQVKESPLDIKFNVTDG